MEKKMENEMETGIILFQRMRLQSTLVFLFKARRAFGTARA